MDIVEELRQNRESGAKRLVSEYKAGLMSLACRFYRNEGDAEELVNATFAKVVENIDDYLEQSAFFAWMCQILTNEFRDRVRRKSNTMEVYPGVVPEVEDERAQRAIFANLDASLLREAIETLPEDIKKTVLLHYFMDMPVKEVARVLSSPTSTITWRLHYARQILAAKLGVVARKPGAKALLALLALGAITALGAAIVGTRASSPWHESNADEPSALRQDADSPEQQADDSKSNAESAPRLKAASPAIDGSRQLSTAIESVAEAVPSTSSPSTSQTPTKEQTMNTATRTAAFGAATALALAAAPPAVTADGYQFIVSGDPEYDPPASFLASDGTSLAGGPLSERSAAGALEARYRTAKASSGTGLRSDAYSGFTVILR